MHGYEAATADSLKPLVYIHTGLVDWVRGTNSSTVARCRSVLLFPEGTRSARTVSGRARLGR